ncbi:hypothetical protein RJ55_07237 [Drechmeria coniospora]|nr:hypothetical protein RJ55_07237 [Drechmeria coniospora]
MPFACSAARLEDGPGLANAYISAFYGDAFHDTLVRGVPFDRQVAGVVCRFPRNFVNPAIHYRKVVDTGSGKIVSYAKWGLGNVDGVEEAEHLFGEHRVVPVEAERLAAMPCEEPEGLNGDFAEAFTAEVQAIRAEVLGSRPMLHLMMLGTVPTAQGQGVGTMQVQWGVDFADLHGLPCWAEASPHSLRILQRFGFETMGEVVCQVDDKHRGGSYIYTCLLREPRREGPTARSGPDA